MKKGNMYKLQMRRLGEKLDLIQTKTEVEIYIEKETEIGEWKET